jgi:hypothetical protein
MPRVCTALALALTLLYSAHAETCIASQYGRRRLRRTASGEIMRPGALTAAHRHLPFGDARHRHLEQHETLGAPDAYEANGGWPIGRSAKVITYSKHFGEVGRVIITPEMVMGAAA